MTATPDSLPLTLDNAPGFIDRWSVYTIDEVKKRLRLGHHAWRTARSEGLPVRPVGRRKYVLGSDVLSWLETKPCDLN
jgi:hypothetical protein